MNEHGTEKWWQRQIRILPTRRNTSTYRWYPSSVRHKDLLELLMQLRSMAALGIPIHHGLEACTESLQQDRRMKPLSSMGRISVGVLVAIWLLAVGLLAIEQDPPIFLLPIALLGCFFFLVVVLVPLVTTSRLANLFNIVRKRLETGASLSETLATLPALCPTYVVDLVRTGEASGALPDMLDRSAALVQKQRRSKDQFRGTSYYLLLVATAMGLMAWFFSIKILPVFWEIYEEFGQPAPASVAALRGMQYWFYPEASYLMTFLTSLLGDGMSSASRLASFPPVNWQSAPGPGFLDWIALAVVALLAAWITARLGWWRPSAFFVNRLGSVPIFRSTLHQTNAARVSTALAVLLEAGVPLPAALQHAEGLSISKSARRALARVREAVEAGLPLSAALKEKGQDAFPESMADYVALGESSRMLPEALAYLGETCEALEETRRNILSEGFLPVGVLVLGLGVLFLQVVVYEALSGLSDAIFYSL